MSAHTPGPWHVKRNRVTTAIRDAKGHYIVDRVVKDRDANAHLIAAAPELLEALRAIVAVIDHAPDRECAAGVLEQARAAIAKAEGR